MAVRDGELSWNALQLSDWIARVIVLVKLPTRGSRQLCHRRLHKCHCLCHVARTRIRYRKQAPRGLQQGLDICNRAPRLQLADDCERRSNCMGCKDKDKHHSERHEKKPNKDSHIPGTGTVVYKRENLKASMQRDSSKSSPQSVRYFTGPAPRGRGARAAALHRRLAIRLRGRRTSRGCACVRLWVGMLVMFVRVIRVSVCPVCPFCVSRLPPVSFYR